VQKQQVTAQQALARAQLENLAAWREGQLGVKQQVADTGAAKMKANAETKGLVVGDNGEIRPMTEDEILSHPILSQNKALAQAAMMSKSAQSDLAQAHQDVLMNPGNPTFQQKEREIQARLQMARAQLAIRQQGAWA
jgi:hypothetical protein